jgi:hypothetical protein
MDGVEDLIFNDVDGFAALVSGVYSAVPGYVAGAQVRFYKTLTRTTLVGMY